MKRSLQDKQNTGVVMIMTVAMIGVLAIIVGVYAALAVLSGKRSH